MDKQQLLINSLLEEIKRLTIEKVEILSQAQVNYQELEELKKELEELKKELEEKKEKKGGK